MCISSLPPTDEFSNRQILSYERLNIATSPKHRFAQKEVIDIPDLENETFAVLSENSTVWQTAKMTFRQSGFEPKVSIVCGDLKCMLNFVEHDLAITIGPELSWKNFDKKAISLIATNPIMTRSTFVFWSKYKKLSPVCELFKNFLIDRFNRDLMSNS